MVPFVMVVPTRNSISRASGCALAPEMDGRLIAKSDAGSISNSLAVVESQR